MAGHFLFLRRTRSLLLVFGGFPAKLIKEENKIIRLSIMKEAGKNLRFYNKHKSTTEKALHKQNYIPEGRKAPDNTAIQAPDTVR